MAPEIGYNRNTFGCIADWGKIRKDDWKRDGEGYKYVFDKKMLDGVTSILIKNHSESKEPILLKFSDNILDTFQASEEVYEPVMSIDLIYLAKEPYLWSKFPYDIDFRYYIIGSSMRFYHRDNIPKNEKGEMILLRYVSNDLRIFEVYYDLKHHQEIFREVKTLIY